MRGRRGAQLASALRLARPGKQIDGGQRDRRTRPRKTRHGVAVQPGEESQEEVAKLAVADMAIRSNIRKVTDPQEIVPVLMAAW